MSSDPPTANLYPGMRLGRYELLCPVAQGGMAQVWVAILRGERGFERLVAIKAILAQHALDQRFQAMFLDEARIISAIRHPNVAQILDLGEQNDALYHVLEWIEGDSLSSLRRIVHGRREKLPLGILLRVVSATCAGLHAAHELKNAQGEPLGVVHRDVSPANVLLSSSGEIKVIDFGVAKALDRMAEETSVGMLKGKVTFMAPEQAMGKRIDRRADVWACGVMLYQLLSGKVPYDAENQIATLHMLVKGTPPSPLRGVPDEVAELAYTALSYAPEGRYGTADEMHRAIETVLVQRCGAVTSADVADYVNRQLSDRIGKRKKMIERALNAAEARNQMVDEFEQALPSERSLSNVSSDLHTPLRTAETAFAPVEEKTAQSQYAPEQPGPRLIVPESLPKLPLPDARTDAGLVGVTIEPGPDLDLDDIDVKRFGTRSRTPLVIAGFVAAIALVSYASYLVWDRISVGDTPSLSH